MKHHLSLDREQDRLMVSLSVALFIHGLLFVLVPLTRSADEVVRQPPLYVSLDVPREDPAADQASALASTAAEPTVRDSESTESPPAAREPSSAVASPRASADVTPDFVPSAPAPPPPPRQRTTDSVRGDFSATDGTTDSVFLESQISSFYDFQRDYQAELSAWEDRQREAAEPGRESIETAASSGDRALADELSRMIEGIRESSRNVVETTGGADEAVPGSPAPGETQPGDSGDGSGVAIRGAGGTRMRTDGAPVDLSGVSLGSGFPPEYPVSVQFTVDSAGRVLSARVVPPSPEPALDRAIAAAIERWTFEPADTAQAPNALGTVTVIVETR